MEIPDRKQIIINTEIPFIYRTYSNVWDIVGQAWDNSRAANPHEHWVVGLWDVWDRKQGYIYREILFIGSFEPVKKFSPIGKMCKTVPQSHRGTRTRMNTGFSCGTGCPTDSHMSHGKGEISVSSTAGVTEKEVCTILERSGYRIPPYRLTYMAKTAVKILQTLCETGPVSYTAKEARTILRMVGLMMDAGEGADQ